MPIPHCQPGTWPSVSDSRFASLIQRTQPDGCEIALIGMPDDTGVKMNNGRPGAAQGPAALRQALASYGVADASGWNWPTVFDAGDVVFEPGDLTETHRRVTEAVHTLVEHGMFPIGIGGGHDLTFPFVRGMVGSGPPMQGVYFDPHLDVRDEAGSGMPFRRLVESGAANALTIHGFQSLANSSEHVRWFQANGGRISDLSPSDPWPPRDVFVSLDLDVIDQAHAPGVSALNPNGWTPPLAEAWVAAAGRNPRVRCFDIMELNPVHDDNGRTARLAAHLLLVFLRAYTERP